VHVTSRGGGGGAVLLLRRGRGSVLLPQAGDDSKHADAQQSYPKPLQRVVDPVGDVSAQLSSPVLGLRGDASNRPRDGQEVELDTKKVQKNEGVWFVSGWGLCTSALRKIAGMTLAWSKPRSADADTFRPASILLCCCAARATAADYVPVPHSGDTRHARALPTPDFVARKEKPGLASWIPRFSSLIPSPSPSPSPPLTQPARTRSGQESRHVPVEWFLAPATAYADSANTTGTGETNRCTFPARHSPHHTTDTKQHTEGGPRVP